MTARSKDRDVYLKFFPSDWRSDEALRGCSLAARGLWIELMCLAHRHGGHVLVNGVTPTLPILARQVVSTPAEVKRLLAELLQNGVASRQDDGPIYSRRMVRDAKRRQINRENGNRGGNPRITDKPQKTDKSDNRKSADALTKSDNTHRSIARDPESRDPEAELFARFWDAYPRHEKRKEAEKAFRKLQPDEALLAKMLSALEWQTRQPKWVKDSGEYVPHPTSWLNQHRWEDEPFHPPAEAGSSRSTVPNAAATKALLAEVAR